MTKPERIAAIRKAIAMVEREECHCEMCECCCGGLFDDDDDDDEPCPFCDHGILQECARCEHLDDLDAQLQEAEGQDV